MRSTPCLMQNTLQRLPMFAFDICFLETGGDFGANRGRTGGKPGCRVLADMGDRIILEGTYLLRPV